MAEVIERLERFDASGALAAALRAWAAAPAPAPELEPVVVDLARLARDPIDPIARTRKLTPHLAWSSVAARREPAELIWLLDAFLVEPISLYRRARRAQSLEKLTALRAFPADPRLAGAHLDSALGWEPAVALELAALLISSGHANAYSHVAVARRESAAAPQAPRAVDRQRGGPSHEALLGRRGVSGGGVDRAERRTHPA